MIPPDNLRGVVEVLIGGGWYPICDSGLNISQVTRIDSTGVHIALTQMRCYGSYITLYCTVVSLWRVGIESSHGILLRTVLTTQ